MINADLNVLEFELRKLEGVKSVGYSSQHDVLYIQLFITSTAPTASLPFEATRIAQRHWSSPVAVELVRWADSENDIDLTNHDPLSPRLNADSIGVTESIKTAKAGSIATTTPRQSEPAPRHSERSEESRSFVTDVPQDDNVDIPQDNEIMDSEPIVRHSERSEESQELDLTQETEQEPQDRRTNGEARDRIVLLAVTTSSENDEIEVHLTFDETRAIGRAPQNRGLLGAIDATTQAIEELTGNDQYHAEWARSLEPGPEHASLVAIGLTTDDANDTRHGIAGGDSPIEAAARATLNALNRVTELV